MAAAHGVEEDVAAVGRHHHEVGVARRGGDLADHVTAREALLPHETLAVGKLRVGMHGVADVEERERRGRIAATTSPR